MNAPPPRLLTLFIERRQDIAQRLEDQPPSRQREILRGAIADLHSTASHAHTTRAARIIAIHVESLGSTIDAMLPDAEPAAPDDTPPSIGMCLPRRIFVVLTVVLIAAIVLRFLGMDELISARVFAVVGVSFVVLMHPTAGAFLRWLRIADRPHSQPIRHAQSPKSHELAMRVCASTLAALDDVLAELPDSTPAAAPSAELERLPDVLDFLHQSLGPLARLDGQRLLDLCETLPQLLAAHGLRAVTFEASHANNAALWHFQPGQADNREPVTIVPALVAEDGRVVRPGRVRLSDGAHT